MFDARAAKALEGGNHLTVDGAPGLRLVANGALRTWTYRYRSPVHGNLRQIRLGHWPALGLPAALAAWERARAQRDAGVDPADEKRQRRRQATVDAHAVAYTARKACTEYLKTYKGEVAAKTYAEAKRLLERELGELDERPAAEVTRAEAFDLLDAMRDRPVVAARLRQLLGAVWDRALDSGKLPAETPNWWRLVLRGKLVSRGKSIGGKRVGRGKRTLSEAELKVVLPWLPNFSRDVEDCLTLYLWTLCRGSEIVAMERDEISEEADGLWWTVPRQKLKMRRNPLTVDLRVPLVGRAEAVVRRRLQATPGQWIFPSVGKAGHVQQKAIGLAVWSHMPYAGTRPDWVRARLAVTHWAPHDLRRTGRTMLAALGCPETVGEAVIGHMPPGLAGTYNRHTYDPERRAWLMRLSARLDELCVPGPAGGR